MAAVKTHAEVVTKHQSLQIMKHTLNLGVSSILYLRNCFEEEAFQALKFEGLHLRQLKPVNSETKRILFWLQKAVYESLQKEYLEHLSLGIHECHSDKMLECYQFHFTYTPNDAGVAVSVRKNQKFETIGTRSCVSKEEAKRQTEALLRSMCCLTQSLDNLPEEHYVSMSLVYNEQAPESYCPEGFQMGESLSAFGSDVPLDALTGEIKTGYHGLTVRIQTLCDSEETYFHEAADAKQKEQCLKQHIKAFITQTGNTDTATLSHLLGVSPLIVSAVVKELQQPGTPRRKNVCVLVQLNRTNRPSSASAGSPLQSQSEVTSAAAAAASSIQRAEPSSITLEARALMTACESLPRRYKFVNKSIVASACVVTEHVAKELLRHLIQRGLVKAKVTRGKGHESTVYVPPAATRNCPDAGCVRKRERKRPQECKQTTTVPMHLKN